jgi:hyaluronoglucosaminidase
VPLALEDPGDRAAFGTDARAVGAAHGTTCARFAEFLSSRGIDEQLLMVPTDYAGLESSPYREGLAATLPTEALVWWTGFDIVVGTVSRDDIDRAAASYQRELLLWDNFPVNDFDRNRLFLGPLEGRTTDVAGAPLLGITANPMVDYEPSKFGLAAVADWAWNTAAYEPASAARRTLALLGAAGVAPLVSALSAWPPSAPQDPGLSALVERALDGDSDDLRRELLALASIDVKLADSLGLASAAAAAAAMSRAGIAALDGSPADALAALAEAEAHDPNVLRGVIPPFVREALSRAGVEAPPPPDPVARPASEHEPTVE